MFQLTAGGLKAHSASGTAHHFTSGTAVRLPSRCVSSLAVSWKRADPEFTTKVPAVVLPSSPQKSSRGGKGICWVGTFTAPWLETYPEIEVVIEDV